MMKAFLILLILANLLLFSFIRWGSLLTQDNAALQLQPPLNADMIKIFNPGAAASAVAPAQVTVNGARNSVNTVHQSVPAILPVSAPVADSCLEWGEFSGTDLTSARADLDKLKLGSNLSQHEVSHSLGYWVYIPPAKSKSAMNSRITQLKKLHIKDYFIVHESGKFQNAISLGVFKAEDVANKYLSELRRKGIKNASVGKRQTHLKFTVFRFRNPSADLLSKLVSWQKEFTGIEMKAIPCN